MTEENKTKDYRKWNFQGFIPGPQEVESSFLERMEFCHHLLPHLQKEVPADLPFDLTETVQAASLKESLSITEEVYGIRPDWVPIFFSNHQLTPWHAGCAWIFQLYPTSPIAAFLQLRASFKKNSSFLGLYKKNELISHELSHVGRMAFQEPKYEEFFAYSSSPSTWRAWWGPIIQSSKESLYFILLLGLLFIVDLSLFSMDYPEAVPLSWQLKLLPVGCVFLALLRLAGRHWKFSRALKNLGVLYEKKVALHVMYRLTDEEIEKFAFLTPEKIRDFMLISSNTSFRWKFLREIYG